MIVGDPFFIQQINKDEKLLKVMIEGRVLYTFNELDNKLHLNFDDIHFSN